MVSLRAEQLFGDSERQISTAADDRIFMHSRSGSPRPRLQAQGSARLQSLGDCSQYQPLIVTASRNTSWNTRGNAGPCQGSATESMFASAGAIEERGSRICSASSPTSTSFTCTSGFERRRR